MVSLIAYLNDLSFEPGQRVDVKVGSYGAKKYVADVRRIIQGDRNPDGPGYRDELTELVPETTRAARQQAIIPGSYVTVPDKAGILSKLVDFTIAVPIFPTRLGDARKCIFTLTGRDIELAIDQDGTPAARLGDASVRGEIPLQSHKWTVVILTFDSASHELCLSLVDPEGAQAPVISRVKVTEQRSWQQVNALIACRRVGEDHFDGKIDSPVVLRRALSPVQIGPLLADPKRLVRHPDVVAFWDFSREMDGTRIVDASPNTLHGTVHQCPARAMTGWRWAGEALDWRSRPDLYTAIHFHADDLSDAGWETDFSFVVPSDAKSGVYSVRLVPDGNEDQTYHCIFAVRPKLGRPTQNRVCFLMPTASYLAYANHRLGLDVPGTEVGMGRLVEIDPHHQFLQEHPELGFSFYEVHSDGSGVFYSSRNRPILDLQPGIKGFLGGLGSNVWQFNADTHITGWLEAGGFGYDVVTDEDLHRDGLALLQSYKVVITGTHPEYYSESMLDTVSGFVERGGRLMYLGGNGFYWRISYSDKHPGVIECRRSEAGIRPWEPGHGQFHHAFTGEYGGLWRRNGRSSAQLTGLVMSSQGFDISEPYALSEASLDARAAFIFEGIKAGPGNSIGDYGLSGGGAAGLEIDRADLALGTPRHALVLGSSTKHTDIYLMVPEDILDPTPDMSGTQSPLIRSDIVFFETRGGGAVFSTGSIAWAGAMAWQRYDNEISALTSNVLRRFENPAPFAYPEI